MPAPQRPTQRPADLVLYDPRAARRAIEHGHASWGWRLDATDDALTATGLADEIRDWLARL